MKSSEMILEAIKPYKQNELILASNLYREKLLGKISEAAFYKSLERMCKSGELVKIAKGTYHKPKITKYGIVPPTEKEIVSAFTENETGTVVGYYLYNTLNLTTQISKTVNVMSSVLDGFSKSIRNVIVLKVPLEFSPEVKNMVEGLEVLQNFNSIQEINYSAFLDFTKKLASSFEKEAFKEVVSAKTYKKSTISFLREILNFYGVKNNLNEYLSTLSVYKHPRMEELYEFAQVSQ